MWVKRALLCFSFFCLFLAQGIILGAQDTAASNMSLPPTEKEVKPSWETLDSLLVQLEQEARLQSEDLQKLSQALQQSKTETDELVILLRQSEQQLASLEQLLNEQAEQLKATQTARNIWRIAGIAGISTSIVLSIIVLLN